MQAFRPPTQVLSCECCEFSKNNFFSRTPPVAAFVSARKRRRRRKRRTKEQGKIFQTTEENENLSFNFYLQVLVLVKTEMQMQLCKCCRTAHPFFLTFSSNFLSCDLWVFIFMFSFLINWKIPLAALFRSRHWELFRKTAVRQDITKTVNFFTKLELVYTTVY